ncbi:hypothetical protein E6W36_00005 [Hankyongella ginsenosidimutans]|uniref:Aminopeptidase N-like N-terminal domain-containing protein n=1 Tax=Hankyongella ginsenosidimutans TaxID=1763828 RepID=A0A4D7C8B9_9SPHN|nr:hypothetical protein [Hankyongella ginsenosidimutans]QCI80475.1 hypothetical protein E6W36_00005 [Hankyongella ginsenosidimutans]
MTGVARLDLASMPAAGAATIRIAYTAPYREGAEGLYRTEVAGKWYGFTQMEPIDGRRMFPSFDEPRFKTPFTVSVSTPTGNKVVANAPLAKTTPQNHGMTLFSFAPTKPLPHYLVALAVGPLDIVEGLFPSAVRKTAVPFRGVATEGQGSRLAYALQHTPKHVALLEDYFGIPTHTKSWTSSPRRKWAARWSWCHHLQRQPDPAEPERADPAAAVVRDRQRARTGAPLVRRSGDAGLVDRHLAEREFCRMDGCEGQPPLATRPRHLDRPDCGCAGRNEHRLAQGRPANLPASHRQHPDRQHLRRHHLRKAPACWR